jgi:uncharacterized protein YukE
MPRVNSVAKCRKSPGQCGKCGTEIKVGEPYKFWAFMVGGRGGPRHVRCGKPECAPKPWDLTQSDFWSAVYQLQATEFDGETAEDLESQRDEVASELENIASEQEDKLSNMPDGLQQGASGELLQERADACRDAAGTLESVDCSVDVEGEPERKDGESDEDYGKRVDAWRSENEDYKNRLEEIRDELRSALDDISCS